MYCVQCEVKVWQVTLSCSLLLMHFTCAPGCHKCKKAFVMQKELRWVYSGENAIFSFSIFPLCYIAESSNLVYIYLGKSEPNSKIFQGVSQGSSIE
jgi:hypothetical protein